ncbi:hypothetical protein Misp02_29090 [Microtetraspora sp. NBRC 16547]|nr:hypothetical protein Misp02_29090 [Microtetraspora sp. NBRC 16547]
MHEVPTPHDPASHIISTWLGQVLYLAGAQLSEFPVPADALLPSPACCMATPAVSSWLAEGHGTSQA